MTRHSDSTGESMVLPLAAEGVAEPIGGVWSRVAECLTSRRIVMRGDGGLVLPAPENGLADALEAARLTLREAGLIPPSRNEPVAVATGWDGAVLAVVDRSAVTALGIRINKVHLNGLVAGSDGEPDRIWLARRSADRRNAPHHLDTTVAGGQAAGETERDTLAKETSEEAAVPPGILDGAVETGRTVVRYPGLDGVHHERLIAYDVVLPADFEPSCRDGEIAGFELVDLAELPFVLDGRDRVKYASYVVMKDGLRRWLFPGLTPLWQIKGLLGLAR